MLAVLRLVRRIGMGVGAWILVYQTCGGIPGGNEFLAAFGAAILAFFLPSIPADSFGKRDGEVK